MCHDVRGNGHRAGKMDASLLITGQRPSSTSGEMVGSHPRERVIRTEASPRPEHARPRKRELDVGQRSGPGERRCLEHTSRHAQA